MNNEVEIKLNSLELGFLYGFLSKNLDENKNDEIYIKIMDKLKKSAAEWCYVQFMVIAAQWGQPLIDTQLSRWSRNNGTLRTFPTIEGEIMEYSD